MSRGIGTQERVTCSINRDIFKAYDALPRQVKKKWESFLDKFEENPRLPGLNYEKLHNSGLYSVRVDKAYRAIVRIEEKTGAYVLLWVGRHDDAYDWANRARCELNKRSGTLQVYHMPDEEALELIAALAPQVSGSALSTTYGSSDVPGATSVETPSAMVSTFEPPVPLFAPFSDDVLLDLGLPEEQLAFVRRLVSREDLERVQDLLPEDAYECLWFLADGEKLDEVRAYYRANCAPTDVDGHKPETIAEALRTDSARRNFFVVEGEEELRKVLDAPLDTWRVFLHPSQRKIVERSFYGPARVLGSAGTGKTVVAMHRAKRLASQLVGSDEKVLFTTFTSNLAADIKTNLGKICTLDEMDRIEVVNLDAWTHSYLSKNRCGFNIVYQTDLITRMWREAVERAQVEAGLDIRFLKDEWECVVVPQEAFTWEKYCRASRVGRGKRLIRSERLTVWKVIEQYMLVTKEHRIRDIDYAYCAVRDAVLAHPYSLTHYRHVVVDEGQDFSPSAYKLIRALAGKAHPDDIFVVGDTHQRIYGRMVTLSACGIDIRGRGSKLRINYRTTDETCRAAESLLADLEYDDLDGGVDTLAGAQSLTHGAEPVFRRFSNMRAEVEWIGGQVQTLAEQGVLTKDICVAVRTNSVAESFGHQLRSLGNVVVHLAAGKEDNRLVDGLRLATMHRVKGLEFDYVFVASLNDGIVPTAGQLRVAQMCDAVEKTLQEERNLLYVAMTRAKRCVYLTCSGHPSTIIAQRVE